MLKIFLKKILKFIKLFVIIFFWLLLSFYWLVLSFAILFLYAKYIWRWFYLNSPPTYLSTQICEDWVEVKSSYWAWNKFGSSSWISYKIVGNNIYLWTYWKYYKLRKNTDISQIKIFLKKWKYNLYYKNSDGTLHDGQEIEIK